MSYPVLLGAIVITTANQRIRFKEAAGAVGNVDLTPGTYYLRGDGTASDFCALLGTALGAFGGGGNTYDVAVSRDVDTANDHCAITITPTGGLTFSLVVDGSSTFDALLIGFSVSTAHDAFAKTSAIPCAACWLSNDVAREIEPFSERTATVKRAASGRVSGLSRSERMQSWRLGLGFVHLSKVHIATLVDVLLTGQCLEGFLERFGAGAAVELHEVDISSGTILDALSTATLIDVVHFSEDALSTFAPARIGAGVPLYSIDLVLHAEAGA